ncbi:hypothetical protein A3A76_02215 [Candidatus Woesebacteria bacterium RIFCSPLOWO2_01_FULL_39_23]|uniref:Uncharacterized protein n=1 Tax=Candidatus Woesebacteria bacterium RIFCSPHIGHO2_01_FULL_40_22 TaxID=1802499 RepID=A0A1F7YI79_9BACT|nr:MAG: hypothetical protein A2141_03370 [Candidatus Woesebacteria bacterium RBG_16_40_11]OGM26215.1 MAG: hypothetical protein A2628_02650 [Candidatus Woesebacteria bacterium RIFCSPHIGHO2_01_FULL_40_22]OGM36473.1 MAG: hypothetical protein A3E41_00470 [Candidatus Woesebacteria bacterium RIFCSPHIGHO2_12_FULL_38_9]OGM62373.1 MAG: hypothetical protein A3A76_02215 [Candidatus Woesebacteria bacterium RIFCSPLOWO2_01_FULL_39_23]
MYLAQRDPIEGSEVINGVATIKGFEWIFNNIVTTILGFAGIALFAMLIVGGFKLMTSGGNPEAAQAARKIVTYAVGGLLVIALAFLILVLIQTFTGANVTTFTVNQ